MSDTSVMKFKIWGCRGSIAARNQIETFSTLPDMIDDGKNTFCTTFGINTTCSSLESEYLPKNTVLFIDSGSGFFTAAPYYYFSGFKKVILLQTHYHYDHTIGLTMSLFTHMPDPEIDIFVYGPKDQTIGPKKAVSHIMHRPVFPIEISERESRFRKMVPISEPRNFMILCHPKYGIQQINNKKYNEIVKDAKRFKFTNESDWVNLSECLVIKCNDCVNHPQKTISYRFEAAGKSAIVLTDHENTDGIHVELKPFLMDADILIMDCQFSKKSDPKYLAGLGHATPDYCVKTAEEVRAKKLYLTHHAPSASDIQIKNIEKEARSYITKDLVVFSLREGMLLEI